MKRIRACRSFCPNLHQSFRRHQALVGVEVGIVLVGGRQPAGQLDSGEKGRDVDDVRVRHLTVVHVLHHGQVLARPVTEQVHLLCDEGRGLSGEARVLPFLAALGELAVAAGADFVDLLSIIEVGIFEGVLGSRSGSNREDEQRKKKIW